jgi:hypothetical protein
LASPRRQHDLGVRHQTLRRGHVGHDRYEIRSLAISQRLLGTQEIILVYRDQSVGPAGPSGASD